MNIPWSKASRQEFVDASKQQAKRLVSEDQRRMEALWKKHQKALALLRNHSLKAIQTIFSPNVLALINTVLINEMIEGIKGAQPDRLQVDSKQFWLFVVSDLQPAQQEALATVLAEKFGPDISVKECLDTDLIAGVRLKIGNHEFDCSLQSLCQEYDQQLIEGLER